MLYYNPTYLNIEEHQKIRKLQKKRLKVHTDYLFTFRKWWRHTRKTQPNRLLNV